VTNSTTATSTIWPGTASPPDRPSWVRQVDPLGALLKTAAGAVETLYVGEISHTPAEPSSAPVLSYSLDESGQVIVEDVLGAAYGVGHSPAEAAHEFFEALDTRLRLLRSRRTVLHPRLARELRELETLFPDR